MSLERLMRTNTVTILKPDTETNRYGDAVAARADPLTETATTGWLAQVSTSEQVGARDVIETGWKLYLSSDENIAAQDRVLIDEVVWEVDGDPIPAQTPRGAHHIECVVRRVTDIR